MYLHTGLPILLTLEQCAYSGWSDDKVKGLSSSAQIRISFFDLFSVHILPNFGILFCNRVVAILFYAPSVESFNFYGNRTASAIPNLNNFVHIKIRLELSNWWIEFYGLLRSLWKQMKKANVFKFSIWNNMIRVYMDVWKHPRNFLNHMVTTKKGTNSRQETASAEQKMERISFNCGNFQ